MTDVEIYFKIAEDMHEMSLRANLDMLFAKMQTISIDPKTAQMARQQEVLQGMQSKKYETLAKLARECAQALRDAPTEKN